MLYRLQIGSQYSPKGCQGFSNIWKIWTFHQHLDQNILIWCSKGVLDVFFAGVWDLQSPPGTWDPMILRVIGKSYQKSSPKWWWLWWWFNSTGQSVKIHLKQIKVTWWVSYFGPLLQRKLPFWSTWHLNISSWKTFKKKQFNRKYIWAISYKS